MGAAVVPGHLLPDKAFAGNVMEGISSHARQACRRTSDPQGHAGRGAQDNAIQVTGPCPKVADFPPVLVNFPFRGFAV